MTISIANKASIFSGTNLASYATGSWTPTTGRLAICSVENEFSGTPNTPTVTGNGLTWDQVATYLCDSSGTQIRITVFVTKTAGGSAGAVTADFAAQTQAGCNVIVDECSGVDVSGTALAAIVQNKNGSANASGTSESITLNSAITGSNASYGVFNHQADETTTNGTGYTTLGVGSHAGPASALMTEYKAAGSTTVDASWTTSAGKGAIALEIKIDTGPITGTASITQAANTVSSTGALPIVGSLSTSQANNTISSDSDLFIIGQLSKSQDNNTVSAAGRLSIIGQLSKSQDDNSLSSSGVVNIAGAAALSQADNALSAQSNIAIVSSASLSQDDNSLFAQSSVTIVGSLSVSQADNTSTSTGILSIKAQGSLLQNDNTISSQSVLPIVGQSSLDQADNILSSSGQLEQQTGTGQLIKFQDNNTSSSTSRIDLAASLNLQQQDNVLSSQSFITLSGSISISQDNNLLSSIGRLANTGQLSVIQADNTLSADQPPPIAGPGNIKIIHSIHEIIKAEALSNIQAEQVKTIRVE